MPAETWKDPTSVTLWIFVLLLLFGVIAGNIRSIAVPTLVTILIPEDDRAKANGLTGTAFGICIPDLFRHQWFVGGCGRHVLCFDSRNWDDDSFDCSYVVFTDSRKRDRAS